MPMPARSQGFTYLGLLFAIVLFGIVLASAGVLWHTQSRREKELELLFAGQQYQQAIAAYIAVQLNGQRAYPKSLDELLEDRRFPMPVRHLRKRYRDPVTNSPQWGLVRVGDGIAGVYSLSNEAPLKRAGFGACCSEFSNAGSYAGWKFAVANAASEAVPRAAPATATANKGNPPRQP